MKRISIYRHCGCPEEYPQNTLAPFEAAIRAGRATGNPPGTVIEHSRQKITGGDK